VAPADSPAVVAAVRGVVALELVVAAQAVATVVV
jgi:hypothetical protein